MKKILLSILTIGVVGGLAFGASKAFFSDTETSAGNTITAGTIDISIDKTTGVPVNIADMKPSYVRWSRHVVRNVGNNPVRLWKHIKDISTSENGKGDAEKEWYNAHPDELDASGQKNDIDRYIEYDMYVGGEVSGIPDDNWLGGTHSGGQVIIDEKDGITLRNIESVFVYLGELSANDNTAGGTDEIVVWQSYHMKDETDNWAQTDRVTFTIEFYGEQVNGTGPISGDPSANGPYTLLLENKDAGWNPIIGDGKWGVLKWAGDGDTFNFSATFEGHGLLANSAYKLIYAPDPWPQSLGGPSTLLGQSTSDSNGNITITGNTELGYDIPHPSDTNYPTGGKIWLVLGSDHDDTKTTAWQPDKYLFEYNLIKYDDTGI